MSPLASRRAALLLGYNLPFMCWTAYAAWRAWGGPGLGFCPTHALLGWCPSCGATTAYAAWLRGAGRPEPFFFLLIVGFVALAIWSVVRCQRLTRDLRT
jgi:hypothetical protein